MNQILLPVMYTLGTAYIARTTSEYVIGAVINKTTDVIKDSAKGAWNYVSSKNKECDYQYEYISTEDDDTIVYVTSRQQDDDWDKMCLEIDELKKKECRRKSSIKTPIYGPIKNLKSIKLPDLSPPTTPTTPISPLISVPLLEI